MIYWSCSNFPVTLLRQLWDWHSKKNPTIRLMNIGMGSNQNKATISTWTAIWPVHGFRNTRNPQMERNVFKSLFQVLVMRPLLTSSYRRVAFSSGTSFESLLCAHIDNGPLFQRKNHSRNILEFSKGEIICSRSQQVCKKLYTDNSVVNNIKHGTRVHDQHDPLESTSFDAHFKGEYLGKACKPEQSKKKVGQWQ